MTELSLSSLYDVVRTFERILGPFPVLVIVVDGEGRVVMSNDTARTAFDRPEIEMLECDLETLVPGLDIAETTKGTKPDGTPVRKRAIRKDGAAFPVEVQASRHNLGDGELVFVALHDLSERLQADQALRESRALLDAVLAGMPAMVSAKTPEGRYEFINAFQAEVFGIAPEQAVGRTTSELLGSSVGKTIDIEDRALGAGQAVSRRSKETLVDAEGRERKFLTTKAALKDRKGNVQRVLSVALDVTHDSAAEERLERLAQHDELTGLPGGPFLSHMLTSQIRTAKSQTKRVGYVVLSIENPREIGAELGARGRDMLIRRLAIRLAGLVPEEAVIGRLDGTGFAILMPDVQDIGDVENTAASLIARAGREVSVGNAVITPKLLCGIAVYPEHGRDAEELMRAADLALTDHSGTSPAPVRRYAEVMSERLRQRRAVERDLRRDLEHGQLNVSFEPVHRLADRRLVGFTANLIDAEGRPLLVSTADNDQPSPLMIAEREGLIVPMAEWLLRQVCTAKRQWNGAGGGGVTVAVALHAQQLHQPDLVDMVEEVLAESGIAPSELVFTLGESVAMEDPDLALGALEGLVGLGVGLRIDQFGIGASSLTHIYRFPVSHLVIGKDIAARVSEDSDATTVALAAIQLASALGKSVSVAGLTNEEQVQFFRDHDCVEGSGPALGGEVNEAGAATMLAERMKLAV